MMQQSDDFYYQIQRHVPFKDGGAADACETHVSSLFNLNKTENVPRTKQ
jgi:hypothetical protein